MQLIHYDKFIEEKIRYLIFDCQTFEIKQPRYIKTHHVILYVMKELIRQHDNEKREIAITNKMDIRYKHSGFGSFLYLTIPGFFKHNVSLGEE